MADFTTLPNFTESLSSDFFMARQGSTDVKMLRGSLFEIAYPVGTIKRYTTAVTPESTGLPGTWEVLSEDSTVLATSFVADPNLGLVSGTQNVEVSLPLHDHAATSSLENNHTHTFQQVGGSSNNNVVNPANGFRGTGFQATSSSTFIEPAHTHSTTISSSGTEEVFIDTLQRNKTVNVWVRIS